MDAVPAHFVQKLLNNLSIFANLTRAGWAAVPQQPVIQALAKLLSRLDVPRPFESQAEADRYIIRANVTIQGMWTAAVLEAAQNLTNEPEERASVLRAHSINARTPPGIDVRGRPEMGADAAGAPQGQQQRRKEARGGGGAAGGTAGRSLAGAMGGVVVIDTTAQ